MIHLIRVKDVHTQVNNAKKKTENSCLVFIDTILINRSNFHYLSIKLQIWCYFFELQYLFIIAENGWGVLKKGENKINQL